MNLSFQVHEIMQMFTSYCFLSIPLDGFTHWFLFCRIQQLRGHYLSFHEFWNSNGRKKIPVLCKPAKHFGVMEEQRSQPNPQLVLVHSRNGTVWSYWRQEISELWSINQTGSLLSSATSSFDGRSVCKLLWNFEIGVAVSLIFSRLESIPERKQTNAQNTY